MTDPKRTAQGAREELYAIVREDASFEEKARRALEVGVTYLGADNGHLTRIDRETDHWEATISTDPPDGQFPPGLELDLETTYCRRTIEANSPVALSDAPEQGWADDPAFETHGLHCYHGTTLAVDGDLYGTVCFVAEEPRDERFSDGETMFAELVTRLLERELERERHEARLARQANLATVLNRVLRHNLRNDMSVVRGYTQLMAEKLDGESYGDTALDSIDKLLSLSRKARELDRVVAAEFEPEPRDVVALVERVAERVDDDYPNASISVEHGEGEISTAVLPGFERAVEELIENAAKHGGESPTVAVAVERVPNAVEIRIADDGPGLADHEADVLETGEETPLTHGSGLGLWLVHWIVTSHDGTVDATVTGEGTTMTVTVPRTSVTAVQEQLTELARARDQYQAAFEEACDAMVILDDDARIVDANPAASDIYGLDSRELLGRSIEEFLPEEFDFEAAWEAFQDSETERDTVTVVGADGVDRRVEYAATADIVPDQHLVISRDVTGREERERKLERAETLFQHAQDACFLVDVGDEFTVQRVNPAYEEATGRSNADVRGKTPRGILGEKQGRAVESRYSECVERREPLEYEEELRIDGETTHWETRIAPVIIDGEVAQLVGETRDITDRKERERRYEAVFDNAYQFMGLLDPDGRVLEANDPALEFGGLDAEDVVGERLWETFWFRHSPETRARTRKAVERASGGEFVREELPVQGVDREVLVDFSIRPVTDDDGTVTFLVPEGRCIVRPEEAGTVNSDARVPW